MASSVGKIGDRIRELRKMEHLSQKEFAASLGVKGGYISQLETHRNKPSEQLILNACRAYGILYDWLKYGKREMYEPPRLTPRGRSIMKEIIEEILSPERKLPVRELALILGIDPHIPSKRFDFPEGFYTALIFLIQIFQENDQNKIEAVLAQLKAFRPRLSMEKTQAA